MKMKLRVANLLMCILCAGVQPDAQIVRTLDSFNGKLVSGELRVCATKFSEANA
jgi:hypothetical protein